MVAVLLGLLMNLGWADDDWAKINQQLDFNHDGNLGPVEIAAGLMNKYYSTVFSLADLEKRAKAQPNRRITLADLGLSFDSENQIVSASPGLKFDKLTIDYDLITLNGTRTTFDFSEIDPSKFGLKKPAADDQSATSDVASGSAINPGPKTPSPAIETGYKPIKKFGQISLVRSTSDLLVGVDGKSQPAYLSYVKNDRNGNNQLLVQGVMASDLGWELASDPARIGNFELYKFDLMPSISFDKATNQTDSMNDVDSLVFRLGALSLWNEYPPPAPDDDFGVVASWDAAYATDFEFREVIPSTELDFLPVSRGLFMGSFDEQEKPLVLFRWAPDLHLEGGDVVDRGDNTKLKDNAAYLRGGPKLALTFVPYGNNHTADLGLITLKPSDFQLDVSYLYYAHAAGNIDGNAHLFQASTTWRVGGSKNCSLVITYQNGITALQLQSAHLLSIGLGLKF